MRFREWQVAVGGAGLPVRAVALPSRPLNHDDWLEFRYGIRNQRLTGLAVAAAESGVISVSTDQHAELLDEHVEAMAHAVRLERHVVQVADLLDPMGIPFRILKGTAVAHLDYSDPALRSFGDADVLFRAEDLDRAITVLTEAGYRRVAPQAREGFDRRFGKGATLVASDDYELDVHRTFAMGPYAHLVRAEELWEGRDTFRLADRELAALAVEQRMLHACFHSVVGNPHARIQPHRDVAEMFLYGEFSADRLLELAEGWQASAVVAQSLRSTWDLFGIETEPPLLAWSRGRPPSPRENRILSLYDARTSYASKSLGSLRVMSWPDRVAFARMLVIPDRGFARGRSRGRWWVRGAFRAFRDRSVRRSH